jgi:hypothetical protein
MKKYEMISQRKCYGKRLFGYGELRGETTAYLSKIKL